MNHSKRVQSSWLYWAVALLSLAAGLLLLVSGNRGAGSVFLFACAMWFLIGFSRRRKPEDEHRDDSGSSTT